MLGCWATLHSYEAENPARTMTMTAVWNNISKHGLLHSLNGSSSFEEEFTGEIVEFAVRAEALREVALILAPANGP